MHRHTGAVCLVVLLVVVDGDDGGDHETDRRRLPQVTPVLGHGGILLGLSKQSACQRLQLPAREGSPLWRDGSEGARATALRTTSTASGSARLRSVSAWRGSPSVATPARRATASETTNSQS